jgi:hypothetical protein
MRPTRVPPRTRSDRSTPDRRVRIPRGQPRPARPNRVSIKKLVQTLRVARSATINVNGQRVTLDPELTVPARAILDRLEKGH